MPSPPTTPTRQRLVEAAFELFEAEGYAATSVDDIAVRAGTGRSTFFRHFPTKEDVVFPDHEALLPRVDARLSTATPTTRAAALREAARIVLQHYLDEGEVARTRYRLTQAVPALRDRELASAHRYLRLFARHTRTWLDEEEDGALRSELVAAAVITAHNHILRAWLRGSLDDPDAAFDHAIDRAVDGMLEPTDHALASGAPDGATVVVVRGAADERRILASVRDALRSRG
jgi:AcrR family transcriptional regulator